VEKGWGRREGAVDGRAVGDCLREGVTRLDLIWVEGEGEAAARDTACECGVSQSCILGFRV